jgi:hypothetical protein
MGKKKELGEKEIILKKKKKKKNKTEFFLLNFVLFYNPKHAVFPFLFKFFWCLKKNTS